MHINHYHSLVTGQTITAKKKEVEGKPGGEATLTWTVGNGGFALTVFSSNVSLDSPSGYIASGVGASFCIHGTYLSERLKTSFTQAAGQPEGEGDYSITLSDLHYRENGVFFRGADRLPNKQPYDDITLKIQGKFYS